MTWPGTVDWGGTGAPTLSTATGDEDIFVFLWDGTKYRAGTFYSDSGGSGGLGTVTSVSVTTANGVSGSVANAATTPAITLTLGAITPTSIGSATTATTQTASDSSTKIATTAFVASATTISASNIGTGTLAAARLPTTGLTITQSNHVIPAPADGATITFDLSTGDMFAPAALTANRTLALSNSPTTSPWARPFTIILLQDGSGLHTVTWFSGISWAGGSPPTLTTTAGKRDVFAFIQIASGTYLGFVVGQNV